MLEHSQMTKPIKTSACKMAIKMALLFQVNNNNNNNNRLTAFDPGQPG